MKILLVRVMNMGLGVTESNPGPITFKLGDIGKVP